MIVIHRTSHPQGRPLLFTLTAIYHDRHHYKGHHHDDHSPQRSSTAMGLGKPGAVDSTLAARGFYGGLQASGISTPGSFLFLRATKSWSGWVGKGKDKGQGRKAEAREAELYSYSPPSLLQPLASAPLLSLHPTTQPRTATPQAYPPSEGVPTHCYLPLRPFQSPQLMLTQNTAVESTRCQHHGYTRPQLHRSEALLALE
ncbi:hypothetical protein MMC31_003673 [Peltigera leucophlebia]|nr:hypothetical protein [Peltigera leucophlebia]